MVYGEKALRQSAQVPSLHSINYYELMFPPYYQVHIGKPE